MADFWQGEIPTLHRLVADQGPALAAALAAGSGARRVSLVLPCHARDLHSAAFREMLPKLRGMAWLHRIVLGLDAGTEADFALAQRCFTDFPQATKVLWWRDAAASGKGLNVWRCFQWELAQEDAEIIALHDCDISPYEPEALARLVTPVARPEFGYRFAKGYYARFSDRLHGRLTRLLFHPLVAALRELFPDEARWRQLAAWRYPLSGEIAIEATAARQLQLHPRWGLETAMLLDVPRLLADDEYCQVDLCERYDHRHQPLVGAAAQPSLMDAADDIIQTLRDAAGVEISLTAWAESYLRHARIAQKRSAHVAWINGLTNVAADEVAALEQLSRRILQAGDLVHVARLPDLRNI